jgi:hypothetical protein
VVDRGNGDRGVEGAVRIGDPPHIGMDEGGAEARRPEPLPADPERLGGGIETVDLGPLPGEEDDVPPGAAPEVQHAPEAPPLEERGEPPNRPGGLPGRELPLPEELILRDHRSPAP